MKEKKIDVLLVSYDDFHNDAPLLIIGRKEEGEMLKIINALQGNEATELYNKLTIMKGE